MKALLLSLADLLAVIWRLVPSSVRRAILKGLFVLESRGADPAQGLARLFAVEDSLTHVINERAIVLGGGVHPKHRLTNYHGFFIDRIADGERVLDVGCGVGEVARSIARARPGATVVGVDNDAGRLRRAEAGENPANISFLMMDVTKSTPEGRWDVVVLSNVLEHIAEREAFLAALLRTVKAGKYLIRVPMFERSWTMPMRRELGANIYSDPDHKIEPSREDARRELASVGLEITEMLTIWGEIWLTARPVRASAAEGGAPVIFGRRDA